MTILAQTKLNDYQERALATRSRRHAKGMYATPSQRRAFKKYLAAGMAALTVDECELLATHPQFTRSQRATMAAMAAELRLELAVK